METVSDTMLPGTLPPRLYQTNPFAVQLEPTEIGEFEYQLSSKEVPATAQELQQMAEEAEESLSQAVNDIVAITTRAGRKRKAVGKVVENARQKLEAQKGRKGKK
jgi:ABC-type transporter Mla subunit MlaD